MNAYRVVLHDVPFREYVDYPDLYIDGCADEAEVVVAETPAKARYLAIRRYCGVESADWPNASVVLTRRDVSVPAGIVVDPPPDWWDTDKERTEAL